MGATLCAPARPPPLPPPVESITPGQIGIDGATSGPHYTDCLTQSHSGKLQCVPAGLCRSKPQRTARQLLLLLLLSWLLLLLLLLLDYRKIRRFCQIFNLRCDHFFHLFPPRKQCIVYNVQCIVFSSQATHCAAHEFTERFML